MGAHPCGTDQHLPLVSNAAREYVLHALVPTFWRRLMKTVAFFIVAMLGMLGSAWAADASGDSSVHSSGTLYHVVLVKFKPDASHEGIEKAEAAFAGLKDKIPGIVSLHWGTNVSPEHRNKGFTHAFVLTFHSDKDRDAYLVAQPHKDLGKVLGPVMDDVLVIDFWAQQ
jgi:hypothetical protein